MATRRNRKTRKTRKNYKKSRKNYKRVKRGGESDFEPRLAEYNKEGPSTFTKSSGYQNMINMRDYDINLKKQQENQIQIGMNKERLSQLTGLKTFQSLEPDQQKDVATTFMSLTPAEQDKYIENFKYLNGGKTKKRRINKKTRGGGKCRDSVSKATTIDELNTYKTKYCEGLVKIKHTKCCKQIEEKITKITNDNNDIDLAKKMYKDLEDRRNNKGIEETKDVAAGETGYESFGRESE